MNDIREKAIKFEAEMYGVATNQFVDGFVNGYQQGKTDAIDIDMDTPMHFTLEQKAWVRKYIAINGERQRIDGARNFVDRLRVNFDLLAWNNSDEVIDYTLAEMQKRGRE